jgi:hypothetical protein
MRFVLLGVVVFSIFGIVMFTTQSFGNSLGTSSEVNKIGTLKISDLSTKTLVGLNLGTADDISSVTLTFKTTIADNDTINISLKNKNSVEIGSGSTIVSPSSTIVTINLGDSVTAIERSTLRTVSITVT